jgi:hypothetical protein
MSAILHGSTGTSHHRSTMTLQSPGATLSLKDEYRGEGSSLNSTSLRVPQISAGLRCAGQIPFRPQSPQCRSPRLAPPRHTLSPKQRTRPPIMKLCGGVVPISAINQASAWVLGVLISSLPLLLSRLCSFRFPSTDFETLRE